MRIGYCKIGRAWNMDPQKWSTAGGDVDVWRLLMRLARQYPNDEIILVGRNSGEDPQSVGMPPNVVNPWLQWLPQMRRDRQQIAVPDERFVGRTELPNTGIIRWYDENVLSTFRELDHLLVWAGQHGTSNSPLPMVGGSWEQLTKPQDSSVIYGSYIVRGINAFRQANPQRREEIWLCPDPRNYLKLRDLKWPLNHPVLGQYDQRRPLKHERYGDVRSPEECGFTAQVDGTSWVTEAPYIYSGLELTALPEPGELPCNDEPGEHAFGMIINENRAYVADNRLRALQEWVLPFWPDCPIFGKWTADSEKKIGRHIVEAPVAQMYDVVRTFRSTFTTPASGSGWATAKPWESFAVGTVCFFHPRYDSQGHIIPTLQQVDAGQVANEDLAALTRWLRVETPDQLHLRVKHAAADDDTWRWLVTTQRRHFEETFGRRLIETHIERRMTV